MNAAELIKKYPAGQNINYDRIMQEVLGRWEKENRRPHVLIHTCCAPCSSAVLERLSNQAEVTVYFYNPNIHPEEEYRLREYALRRFIDQFNRESGRTIHFLAGAYEPELFFDQTKALKDEPEGGARCHVCYRLRLHAAALKARELSVDYFTSSLTISPLKRADVINRIGFELQEELNVNFLPSDFKKNNGYKRSVELTDIYGIYRQNFCGCVYASSRQALSLKEIAAHAEQKLTELKALDADENSKGSHFLSD